jgi:hypothetical protein
LQSIHYESASSAHCKPQHKRWRLPPRLTLILALFFTVPVRPIEARPTVVAASFGRWIGKTPRHNVAIIVDTTASMNVVDNGSQCGTRLTCVTSGLRILLSELTPCMAKASTCATIGSNGLANAVDVVSLFAFPNVVTGTASADFDCSDKYPTTTPNTFPQAGDSAYIRPNPPPGTPTYQIVGFSNDYRTSSRTAKLNPDSDIVKALYGVSGCKGLKAVGGEGDYFAGAIYAAQSALLAEQKARPGSQNSIVLISDGYAGAIRRKMAEGATDSGVYPSWINECGQAIIAANAASSSGTRGVLGRLWGRFDEEMSNRQLRSLQGVFFLSDDGGHCIPPSLFLFCADGVFRHARPIPHSLRLARSPNHIHEQNFSGDRQIHQSRQSRSQEAA